MASQRESERERFSNLLRAAELGRRSEPGVCGLGECWVGQLSLGVGFG